MRSAAGPTAGRLWTAQAGAPGTNLTDVEWRTATRYRLGVPLGPGRYHCQNRASDPEALRPTCGSRLGGYGCHALCCAYGPLRNTHHNEVADLIARMSQEAGATVTRETPIREFQTDRPAILDVTAFGTAEIVDLIVDVTIRHPTCKKYGRTDLENSDATAPQGDAKSPHSRLSLGDALDLKQNRLYRCSQLPPDGATNSVTS